MPPRYRYEEIADDLQQRIRAGEFQPGSRLPSRRELIAHYEITEPVIDRAMQILRIKEITETLPGRRRLRPGGPERVTRGRARRAWPAGGASTGIGQRAGHGSEDARRRNGTLMPLS